MIERRTVAAGAIGLLGAAIAIATAPFFIGLLGAPILAVTFAPLNARLARRTPANVAASLTVVVALLAVLLPALAITVLLISELPAALSGPGVQRVLAALGTMHVGRFAVGLQIATFGADFAGWVSRQAITLVGGATRLSINLLIAFLGLYFLLRTPTETWIGLSRLSPFSERTTLRLQVRFQSVTRATLLGIGATAVLQGGVVGGAFALTGLSHPLLWGTVTGLASILPVFGSALVWLPGVVVLAIDGRFGAAIILAILGAVVASNIDNVVRPLIYRRVSDIHPLITVVGAFAGMRCFGLLGVLLGPLALVYFVELVRAFEHEYIGVAPEVDQSSVRSTSTPTSNDSTSALLASQP